MAAGWAGWGSSLQGGGLAGRREPAERAPIGRRCQRRHREPGGTLSAGGSRYGCGDRGTCRELSAATRSRPTGVEDPALVLGVLTALSATISLALRFYS